MNSTSKNLLGRLVMLALAAMLVLPALTFAQGRGRGKNKNKKQDVFVNGHDARDGRYDGRGPRRDRHDDEDRERRRNRQRDRDRDDDDINDRTEIRRLAVSNGYREGYDAGREDRDDGNRHDFRDEGEYRDATSGYRSQYGNRDTYRRYFREGFQRGYNDSYQNRDRRDNGSGWGDILGGIFGGQ
ncbi:MAG: hypothetical protein ACR2GW_04105 [Pyrinomonadaceae bacterium]